MSDEDVVLTSSFFLPEKIFLADSSTKFKHTSILLAIQDNYAVLCSRFRITGSAEVRPANVRATLRQERRRGFTSLSLFYLS